MRLGSHEEWEEAGRAFYVFQEEGRVVIPLFDIPEQGYFGMRCRPI